MYILSKELLAKEILLILAFGKLSTLEVCSLLSDYVQEIISLCENVNIVKLSRPCEKEINEIAGIHKLVSPLLSTNSDKTAILRSFFRMIASRGEIKRVSISAYCGVNEQEYEDLIRNVLDVLNELGFYKIKLVRGSRQEILAEQILLRKTLDIVSVKYDSNYHFGPTIYVPDIVSFRARGIDKPVKRAEIAISPRLAKVLINISGVSRGKTLLDPFCGSGTIIIEGILASINCIGIDKNAKRVNEAERNLKWITTGKNQVNFGNYELRVGEARALHKILRGRLVDAIVTEPILIPKLTFRPKQNVAEKMLNKAAEVYSEALESMVRVLSRKGRIVLTVPVIQTSEGKEIYLNLEQANKLGLKYFQPSCISFNYPIILSSQSTRWLKRGVYVFELS